MYDTIKADLRFGLYAFANRDSAIELRIASECDEQVETGLMERLVASERMVAAAHARQLRDLARFAKMRPPKKSKDVLFSEFAADEVAVALGWTRNVAHMRLHLALALTTRLPGTLAALERGDIDLRRAQALAEITDPLPVETARAVEEAVLPKAARWNTSELRRAARRAVLRLDPAGAEQRHQARRQQRRVELFHLDDAMAELRAYLTVTDAMQIYDTLDRYARATAPGDERTMDQRRADVFTDLILHPAICRAASAGGNKGAAQGERTTTGRTTGVGSDDSGNGGPAPTGRASRDGVTMVGSDDGGRAGAAAVDGGISREATRVSGSEGAVLESEPAGDGVTVVGSDDGGREGAAAVDGGISREATRVGGSEGAVLESEASGDGATGVDGNEDSTPGDDVAEGAKCRGWQSAAAGIGVGENPAAGSSRGGRSGAAVHVTMPASTLLGLDDQPGELAGYGAIPASLARELAAEGTWRRLLTDPVSGHLLDYGRSTYRPPAALAGFVRARDRWCIFPGCMRPATRCDLDHRKRWPDGTTSAGNLQCLCEHHHRLKHETEWTVEYHDGVYIWTSPEGHQYTREIVPVAEPCSPQPPPELAQVPSDDAPPF